VPRVEEQAGRVGDRHDPLRGEVEAADLVDRSEAVLDGADHPQPRGALALEVQHHVDEVLEDPRPGDRPVLGDVADDHQGDVAQLRHPDQGGGDLLDLGDASGHAVHVADAHRLHRVDDQQRGLDRLDMAEHRSEVGLGGEVELLPDGVGAVSAHPHLRSGLLPGDVEHPVAQPCRLRGHLEQQRRLADPRLTGEQDRGTGHQATAEHTVELGHAAGAGQGVLDRDLADRQCRRRDGTGLHPALRGRLLHHGAPGLALRAATDPLAGLPAALVAVVGRPGCLRGGLRHDPNAR
jgi:hypothetical protein